MGTPAPIFVPGDDCLFCWGDNKPFGVLPPPKYLTVEFAGIEKNVGWVPLAGEPEDRTFTLTQHPAIPCRWEHAGPGGEFVQFVNGAISQSIVWRNVEFSDVFSGTDSPGCVLTTENEIVFRFHNGTATLTILSGGGNPIE